MVVSCFGSLSRCHTLLMHQIIGVAIALRSCSLEVNCGCTRYCAPFHIGDRMPAHCIQCQSCLAPIIRSQIDHHSIDQYRSEPGETRHPTATTPFGGLRWTSRCDDRLELAIKAQEGNCNGHIHKEQARKVNGAVFEHDPYNAFVGEVR